MVLFIGLDVGTQGTKAILYDDHLKKIIKQSSQKYGLIETRIPNRAEQHPQTWIDACVQTIKSLTNDKSIIKNKIKGIGVSGQQHGLVPLDINGKVIRNAKLWCDLESAKEAEELSEKYKRVVVPSLTITKLEWFRRNEIENYKRMHSFLLPHDYINYYLTGEQVMECGDASGTGIFNIKNKQFDLEAIEMVDKELIKKIPKLIKSPNEKIGTIKSEISQILNIPKDVIVSLGSGDNMMSALGSGAVHDGIMVMSLGTSGTLFGCSTKPIFDTSGIINGFCDATGQWLPLICTLNCTGALEEIKQCFKMTHDELTMLANDIPPGCHNVNFIPYFNGERTPNLPYATGQILGLRSGYLSPGLLYRATMEGTIFSLFYGMEKMKSLGFNPKELRVVGGGAQNELWCHIISDVFQLPLKFPVTTESAALGAALQAGAVYHHVNVSQYVDEQCIPLKDEMIDPNEDLNAIYQNAYERHYNFLGLKI